jgi:hypothetical protein
LIRTVSLTENGVLAQLGLKEVPRSQAMRVSSAVNSRKKNKSSSQNRRKNGHRRSTRGNVCEGERRI